MHSVVTICMQDLTGEFSSLFFQIEIILRTNILTSHFLRIYNNFFNEYESLQTFTIDMNDHCLESSTDGK
jgi:hypothetical protein